VRPTVKDAYTKANPLQLMELFVYIDIVAELAMVVPSRSDGLCIPCHAFPRSYQAGLWPCLGLEPGSRGLVVILESLSSWMHRDPVIPFIGLVILLATNFFCFSNYVRRVKATNEFKGSSFLTSDTPGVCVCPPLWCSCCWKALFIIPAWFVDGKLCAHPALF
jgi:hypothetical protein